MPDATTLFIAAVFLFAGIVKGVIGLGLPTIAMGLLAVVMSPVEAAAILIVPAFMTNVWQMLAGPSLGSVARRLWPMLLAVCLGTWCGAPLMRTIAGPVAAAVLGGTLILYALSGLAAYRVSIPAAHAKILGAMTGFVTGLITAATGVFVIPAVPYLQAIEFENEELVQALGLSFTVSTVALAVNISGAGAFNAAMAGTAVTVLALTCIGMWTGQKIRRCLSPAAFRRWFFGGLLLLGIYLLVRAFV